MRLPRCHRVFSAPAPGVFAKGLLGHRLLAYVAQEHYVQGTTMGRLARQLGLHRGSLLGAMHDLPPGWNQSRTGWSKSSVGPRSSTLMRRAGAMMAATVMPGSFARRA